jgi:hypothetical protein
MEPSQGDSDTVVVEENDSMTLTIPVHEVTSSDVVFEHRSSRLLVQYAGNRRKRYQDLLGGQGQHFLADVARQLGESRGEDEEGGEQLVVVDEEGSLSRHHPVTEEEKSSIVARAASRMVRSYSERIGQTKDKSISDCWGLFPCRVVGIRFSSHDVPTSVSHRSIAS